jgi:phosphoglycolate phosphatase-like HAD superfamily hydrolase
MAFLATIAFDFDGVILESVDIKSRAFVTLFADYPQHAESILAHHLANVGVPRYDKFRFIYRSILGQEISDSIVADLDRRFARIVRGQIRSCPFVPGAAEFIGRRSLDYPLFVVSGTPQVELRTILEERGLLPFFAGVYGSPRRKPELLRKVVATVGCDPDRLLFLGDAPEDYAAAEAVGARFAGRAVPPGPSAFGGSDLLVFADFRQLESDWKSFQATR